MKHAIEAQNHRAVIRTLLPLPQNVVIVIASYDIVVVDVTGDRASDWQALTSICAYNSNGKRRAGVRAVSVIRRGPRPRLDAEQMGALVVPITDQIPSLVEEIDLLLAEASALRAAGPSLKFHLHEDARGSPCAQHFEAAYLVYRSQEYHLALGRRQLWLLHYLALRHFAQNTAQITDAVRRDPFHAVGCNGSCRGNWRLARIEREGVYIRGLCRALNAAFAAAHMPIGADQILTSDATTSNSVRCRLRASI